MIPLFTTTPAPASPEETPGRHYCTAVGLTADLPERLAQDGGGRPFAPATLSMSDDPHRLPALIELLLRREPVGGAEALIQTNRAALIDLARERLRERLAVGAAIGSVAPLLRDIQQLLRQLADDLSRRTEVCEREYAATQATLRSWQAAATRKTGALQALVGWVFGGDGGVPLPQAVAAWNERERLSLARLGLSAAGASCGLIADEVRLLIERQAAARQAAERAARQAQRRAEAGGGGGHYAPWSWQIDVGTVAAQLVTPAQVDRAIAELVGQVTEDGGVERLAERAHALAEAIAAEAVAPLTLAAAIELEAAAAPVPGADPVVLVGQQLLAELEQRAAWQLQRGARTRSELVQITPGGEPIYRMDGLTAAAYGDGADRLGFLELELHAAPEDLRLTQEAAKTLAPILATRNLYVLEELALAAQEGLEAPVPGTQTIHQRPGSQNGSDATEAFGDALSAHHYRI